VPGRVMIQLEASGIQWYRVLLPSKVFNNDFLAYPLHVCPSWSTWREVVEAVDALGGPDIKYEWGSDWLGGSHDISNWFECNWWVLAMPANRSPTWLLSILGDKLVPITAEFKTIGPLWKITHIAAEYFGFGESGCSSVHPSICTECTTTMTWNYLLISHNYIIHSIFVSLQCKRVVYVLCGELSDHLRQITWLSSWNFVLPIQ
jgi:hypothetical protein